MKIYLLVIFSLVLVLSNNSAMANERSKYSREHQRHHFSNDSHRAASEWRRKEHRQQKKHAYRAWHNSFTRQDYQNKRDWKRYPDANRHQYSLNHRPKQMRHRWSRKHHRHDSRRRYNTHYHNSALIGAVLMGSLLL